MLVEMEDFGKTQKYTGKQLYTISKNRNRKLLYRESHALSGVQRFINYEYLLKNDVRSQAFALFWGLDFLHFR